MSEQQFSKLTIQFSEQNHASVFFAHLQNILISTKQSPSLILLEKIDKILYDIFKQYHKLEKQYFSVSTNLRNVLVEFTDIIDQCKSDKQELAKVIEDRQKLMERLKGNVQESLVYVQENQQLQNTINKLQQLNQLLYSKNQTLEEQIQNRNNTDIYMSNFSKIKDDYDKIIGSNNLLTKQFQGVQKQTQVLASVINPLHVISLAFNSKSTLKDTLWQQILINHKQSFHNLELAKKQFYSFDFQKVMKELK